MGTRKRSASQPPDALNLPGWPPPAAREYLRTLQAEYRPGADLTRGKNETHQAWWGRVVDDARAGRFNADHVTALLVGWPGPWVDAGFPRAGLPYAVNQLRRITEDVHEQEARRPERVLQNRRISSAINLVKSLPLSSAEWKADMVSRLEQGRRPVFRFRRLKGSGITVHPSKAAARQRFWEAPIVQLACYLERTTREPEGERFRITARILSLVSGGVYPDDWRRVKQRYYRAMGLTKPPRPAE